HLDTYYHLSFYAHRDPRDLHSFPTRRSSDLPSDFASGRRLDHLEALQNRRVAFASPAEVIDLASPRRRHERLECPDDVNAMNLRSEEHTSELQSRFDLVCRLLLEKKKN